MHFTEVGHALLGGALIGISASLMLMSQGRITGISGVVGGMLSPQPGQFAWRAWFLSGLLAGGAIMLAVQPMALAPTPVPASFVVVAGLLVGFGTRLGRGCTSGHGVCGVSRLSPSSLVATATFIVFGAIATYLVQHVLLAGDRP